MESNPLTNTDHLIFIPRQTEGKASRIFGVLDSSGSMSSYWKNLSICYNQILDLETTLSFIFSTEVREVKNTKLSDNIHHYNCASTNIAQPFTNLNKALKESKEQEITIIFISDGEDSTGEDLKVKFQKLESSIDKTKKINFITVGVGSGFPTFIAMQLRQIYHNGEQGIPPVFLIQKPVDLEEWQQNFDQIKTFLNHNQEIKLSSGVKQYPWSEKLTNQAFESSWVLSPVKELNIIMSSDKITTTTDTLMERTALSSQDLIEILKYWVSAIQLLSLQNPSIKEKAKIAYEKALELKEKHDALMKDSKKNNKSSVKDRVLKKLGNTTVYDIQVLMKELKSYSEDNLLSNLNEFEAAKRLAIGTQVGKYHDKALKIRGLSVDEYSQNKLNFIKTYKETTINPETLQEVSIFSLQTMKDIFLETDLLEAVQICDSQYDLVEAFPVVGNAIFIKRSDASMINPYAIEVIQMAKHHKVVDTVSILQQGGTLKLKIGDDEEEQINAVIPLFTEKDADLKPLLVSKLFSILMTFNLMQNVDTCFDNAYAALLANTLLFLIKQKESAWREENIKMVYSTNKIMHAGSKGFQNLQKAMLETTRLSTVTEHPDIPTKCEDMSKLIMCLYATIQSSSQSPQQSEQQQLSKDKIKEIVEAMFAEIVGRLYPHDEKFTKYFSFLGDNDEAVNFQKIAETIAASITDFSTFPTINHIRNYIKERETAELKDLKIDLKTEFNTALFVDQFFYKGGKYSYQSLEAIAEFFGCKDEVLTTDNFIKWLHLADQYHNSYERNQKPFADKESIFKDVEHTRKNQILNSSPITDIALKIVLPRYQVYIEELHQYECLMPLNQKQLEKECKERNIDFSKLKMNSAGTLLVNACISKKCPWYLDLNVDLGAHLSSNNLKVPAFHKSCLVMSKSTPEEVFQAIIEAKCIDKIPGNTPEVTEYQKEYLKKHKDQMLEAIGKLCGYYIENPKK